MSDSSPKSPAEMPPEATPEKVAETTNRSAKKNWPLWLGGGFFGLVGIALLVSIGSLMGTEAEEANVVDSPSAAPAEANPPDDLRAHQALVNEVVADLGRDVLIGDSPTKGNPDAEIVMLEFSDFQCPSCKRMNLTLKSLIKSYGNQILLVYKNFPLDNKCNPSMPGPMHQLACDMATLARCAGQYGKFWQYHDLVFDNQQSASPALLRSWAKEVGLNDEQIKTCLSSKSIIDKIRDDIQIANKLGVNSTPTFYINGYKFVGRGANALKLEIDKILNR